MAGEDVYIVGGANSAGQAALHLARYARSVTLVVRAPSLAAGMSHYLVQELEATPNVHVRLETTVVGGGGEGHLDHLVLRSSEGHEESVAAGGLFVLIGARPNTDWLPADDRPRSGRLPADRSRPRRDGRMATRALPVQARDEPAAGVRRRRRPARLGEAGRLGGGRGRGDDPAIYALFASERLHPGPPRPQVRA